MNRFKKLLMIIFVSLGLNSCGILVKSVAEKRITIENHAIPPHFGKDNTTLLVMLHGKRGHDKWVKKHVANEYHGKYEFVLQGKEKYDYYVLQNYDINEYRYVFKTERSTTQDPMLGTLYTSSTHILDRKRKEIYKCPFTTSLFSKVIKAYMINLEKVRKSNELILL